MTRPLPASLVPLVVAAYVAGEHPQTIGDRYGISRDTVVRRAVEAGAKPHKHPGPPRRVHRVEGPPRKHPGRARDPELRHGTHGMVKRHYAAEGTVRGCPECREFVTTQSRAKRARAKERAA